jgi:hypothetical protein
VHKLWGIQYSAQVSGEEKEESLKKKKSKSTVSRHEEFVYFGAGVAGAASAAGAPHS